MNSINFTILMMLLHLTRGSLQSDDIHSTIFSECDDNKLCIGDEDGCVESRDCRSAMSVVRKGRKFIFELQSMKTFRYVAVGFSSDRFMGDDAAIECVREGDEVKLYSSITEVTKGNYGARRDGVPQDKAQLVSAYVKDNQIFCRFELTPELFIGNLTFNLEREDFHLMLASGDTQRGNHLAYHVIKHVTKEKVKLRSLSEKPSKLVSPALTALSTERAKKIVSDAIYSGCGVTKTCFGLPNGCVDRHDCKSFTSATKNDGKFIFEMRSRKGASYIALGLSHDAKMGHDSIVECVKTSNGVKLFNSVTTDGPPYASQRSGVPQNITIVHSASITNDIINCRFEKLASVEISPGLKFDLNTDEYFLMLATGDSVTSDSINQHTERAVSSHAINFNSFKNVSQKPKTFINIHGSLMIAAWFGCSAFASLMPRFYKKNWLEESLFKKDIWFAFHIGLMYATVVMTLVAAVIIFIDMEGLSMTQNPHWIFGLVTITLMFAQVVYAYFRPSPLSKHRACFKVVHWIVGNATQIAATCAVYFSVFLEKSGLGDGTIFYFLIFLAVYVVMHLVMYILKFKQENRGYQPPSDVEFTAYNRRGPKPFVTERNKKFAQIRIVALYVYFMFITFFLAGALRLIWKS